MRKVYCDICGNKYYDVHNMKMIWFQDHYIDVCESCLELITPYINSAVENAITEQKVRETTSDNKDVKEKSPDNE